MFQGHELDKEHLSPSIRREWIEMESAIRGMRNPLVSLHTEGVD